MSLLGLVNRGGIFCVQALHNYVCQGKCSEKSHFVLWGGGICVIIYVLAIS